MTVYACSCSKLLKLFINNDINNTKKLLCICRRFKCLLIKIIFLAKFEELKLRTKRLYDVFCEHYWPRLI